MGSLGHGLKEPLSVRNERIGGGIVIMKSGNGCIRATWLRRCAHYFSRRPSTPLLVFFVLSSSMMVSALSVGTTQYRYGTIEGTVTDFVGVPISNATVYVLQDGRAPTGITDAKGNFVLTNVEVGQHRIFAYKESDGYPNPVWSFYGEAQ